MAPRLSVWLLPAEPMRSRLQAQIDALAAAHAAPRFAPHVTLLEAGGDPAPAVAQALLTHAAAGLAPFAVRVSGVAESDDVWRALTLTVVPDALFAAVHTRSEAALAAAGLAGKVITTPHVSLLYQRLPVQVRQALARAVDPPPAIVCDALALVTSGPNGWDPVASWRVCAEVGLSPEDERALG